MLLFGRRVGTLSLIPSLDIVLEVLIRGLGSLVSMVSEGCVLLSRCTSGRAALTSSLRIKRAPGSSCIGTRVGTPHPRETPEGISPRLRIILCLLPLLTCPRMGRVSLRTSRGTIRRSIRPGEIRLWRLRLCTRSWPCRCTWVGESLCFARERGLGRSVELAIAGAQPIRIIFEALLRVTENLVGRLDGLELGVVFGFFARVPIGVVFES